MRIAVSYEVATMQKAPDQMSSGGERRPCGRSEYIWHVFRIDYITPSLDYHPSTTSAGPGRLSATARQLLRMRYS